MTPIHPARAMPFATLGLALGQMPAEVRPYLFAHRKSGAIVDKARDGLMRSIRPSGNVLPGYRPSFAMNRIIEDAAG